MDHFCRKLNNAKGYDVFAKTIKIILDKFPGWRAKVIGDEKREKIIVKHKNVDLLVF